MAERTVVKKVENAVLFSDGTIRYDNVILMYPALFVPKKFGGSKAAADVKAKYSTQWLMPKASHRKAATELTKSVFEGILAEKKIKALASEKKFLRNGDELGKEWAEGMFVGSAGEENPTSVRGRDKKLIDANDAAATRLFFSGTFANILIRPWFQDHVTYGKRINAGLVAVQYVKKGERIAGNQISDEAIDDSFEEVEGVEDDDNISVDDDDNL